MIHTLNQNQSPKIQYRDLRSIKMIISGSYANELRKSFTYSELLLQNMLRSIEICTKVDIRESVSLWE